MLNALRAHQGRAWYLYLGAAGVGTALYFFAPKLAGSGVLFNILGISASVAILAGIRRHRPVAWIPWLLFAVAQAFFVMGDVLYYTLPAIVHYHVDFPSFGDIFYVTVYPLIIVGLILLIRARTPHRDWESLIDAAIIGIGVGVVSWVFLMVPYATSADLSLGDKTLSIVYPFMDVLVVTVTARLVVGSGRRVPAFYLMLIGAIALVITDSVYGFIELNGTYQTGSWLDVGWLAYYVCWGAAALHPSMRTLSERVEEPSRSLSAGRLAVLTVAALLAPVVEATRLGSTQLASDGMLVGGSIVMFMLVIVRLRLAARRQEWAARRERALREAGAALVSASSERELFSAAVTAAQELAADSQVRVLVTGDDLRELVVVSALHERSADAPALSLEALPAGAQELLLRGSSAYVETMPDSWAWPLSGLAAPMLLAPLMAQAKVTGLLVLSQRRRPGGAQRASVEALASQVALALEAVTLLHEQYRQQSEQRLHTLVRNSSEVITVVDEAAIVRYESPSIESVFGYDASAMAGFDLLSIIEPSDRDAVATLVRHAAAAGDGAEPLNVETRLVDAAGAWHYVELRCSAADTNGAWQHVVVNIRDVNEQRMSEQKLMHQTLHDPLTDLPNRALFEDRLRHAVAMQKRQRQPLAVLIADVDDFKRVNDSYGYAAGDALIARIAERLLESVREADTVARLGSDQFALLLQGAAETQALHVIADFQDTLAQPFQIEGGEVVLSISVGLAVAQHRPVGAATAGDLLRDAGIALNVAKADGRNTVRVFDASMRDSAVRRLSLAADLHHALERGELRLLFQPVVELQTGRVVGAEALIRWAHPEHGMLSPAEFIPIAEETGLIVPLGRWIINQACRTAAAVQRAPGAGGRGSIGVNISAVQLQDPDLVVDVERALRAAAIDPRSLTLEITESTMMRDVTLSATRLGELAALGVELAVDDFGTGYSSLNYLRQFPVDVLKIDKSFVDRIARSRDDRAIARAIVQLASALELQVVAEGIEDIDQLQQLLRLGCRYGQGYLLSRPIPAAELLELVRTGGIQPRKRGRDARSAALTAA